MASQRRGRPDPRRIVAGSSAPGAARRAVAAILRKAAIAAVGAVVLVPSAAAGSWSGSCDVTFRCRSTLHDFAGKVRCQPFRVATENAAGGGTIVPRAEIAVAAAEMDTGNRTRDRQMREMLQSERFPRIRGIFPTIDPESLRRKFQMAPDGKVPLEFTLSIRDIERPVHAIAGNFRESAGTVSFDVEYAVSLEEYRLVPPRPFFGLLRVDDRVLVSTAVRLDTGGPK